MLWDMPPTYGVSAVHPGEASGFFGQTLVRQSKLRDEDVEKSDVDNHLQERRMPALNHHIANQIKTRHAGQICRSHFVRKARTVAIFHTL
jgi:hypothetical protein